MRPGDNSFIWEWTSNLFVFDNTKSRCWVSQSSRNDGRDGNGKDKNRRSGDGGGKDGKGPNTAKNLNNDDDDNNNNGDDDDLPMIIEAKIQDEERDDQVFYFNMEICVDVGSFCFRFR